MTPASSMTPASLRARTLPDAASVAMQARAQEVSSNGFSQTTAPLVALLASPWRLSFDLRLVSMLPDPKSRYAFDRGDQRRCGLTGC